MFIYRALSLIRFLHNEIGYLSTPSRRSVKNYKKGWTISIFSLILNIQFKSSADLVRLRRCSRKINDFFEEHRFEIGLLDLEVRVDVDNVHFQVNNKIAKVLGRIYSLSK